MNGLGRTAGGVLLFAALAPCAWAQQILHAPEEIRACLCREQSVSALAAAVKEARQSYDERQKEVQSLAQRADEARQRLDAANLADRAAFAQLLDSRDAASDHFAADVVPRYNDLVRRYDDTVTAYNRDCAGKAYDPEILPQVRASLACPPTAMREER
jgi:hypothetical protein